MSVLIIAEIGVNHQRDVDMGKRLIAAASHNGADVAKFQASVPGMETSARYAADHLKMISELIPTPEYLREMAAFCAATGIEFMCTPAEEESLKLVVDLGVKAIKVGSDNLVNPPFLDAVAETKLPVILSTGMATYGEIEAAVKRLDPTKLTLLHCVSAYPAKIKEANVQAVASLRAWFPKIEAVGFSDHTQSMALPAVAVGLGAEVIEKHLTLDHKLPGPDHKASLIPYQFAGMVRLIREAEAGLGDGSKNVQPGEEGNRVLMRKSLVALRRIEEGELFSRRNLGVKRPGTGLSPRLYDKYVGGMRSTKVYEEDEQI